MSIQKHKKNLTNQKLLNESVGLEPHAQTQTVQYNYGYRLDKYIHLRQDQS